MTRALKKIFTKAKITAIDIAPGMIEYVKSTNKVDAVEFICEDIEEMVLKKI